VLGSRRIDGQACEGSKRANGRLANQSIGLISDRMFPPASCFSRLNPLQRRDGRRTTIAAIGGYSTNGSSYSACRDLESHFSCSLVYLRLAVHRNTGGNLRPHCSFENPQVWRCTRRKRRRDGGADLRLHRPCAWYHGDPAAAQHDSVGPRAITTAFH
jgi:hypothetical protein